MVVVDPGRILYIRTYEIALWVKNKAAILRSFRNGIVIECRILGIEAPKDPEINITAVRPNTYRIRGERGTSPPYIECRITHPHATNIQLTSAWEIQQCHDTSSTSDASAELNTPHPSSSKRKPSPNSKKSSPPMQDHTSDPPTSPSSQQSEEQDSSTSADSATAETSPGRR